MAITQTHRILSVSTPLGPDALLLESFSGTEGISMLFSFQLFMMSERQTISFESVVGQKATIRLDLVDGTHRYFNGYIRSFSQITTVAHSAKYQAEMVPWLWFLTQTTNCRIFQNKTVPEIIKKIFQDRGFLGEVDDRLEKSYESRDYCVQYRETDFNFVSRLMEEEGIFYFFEQSENNHRLVLGDSPNVHKPCVGQATARFHRGQRVFEEDDVFTFRKEQHYIPGKYTLSDYHFLMPNRTLRSNTSSVVNVGENSKYEVFDYPGYYARPRFDEGKTGKVQPEGDRQVKLRMEGEETQHLHFYGTSTCRAFASGHKFTLADHTSTELNSGYVLTKISHEGLSNLPGTSTGASYSNSFTAISEKIPFRPPRLAPKPTIPGSQTAVVVGKEGEEIWTDKYSRVKVQFHWDREGKKDENSSCWVRVGTLWAGKQWGVIHIPRVGQEVIVDFLEGDPDQPIVVGSVYNAEQMPPFDSPANQTQSGIKSHSSKGGGQANFNEFRFEDKKGEEEVYLHAEKDWKIKVEHDKNQEIDHDETLTVQNNRTTTVMMDHSETVGKNQTITIGVNQSADIGASQSTTVGASITINAGASITITAGGTVTITAPAITLNAAMVQVSGVVQCASLVTNSVVSPSTRQVLEI